MLSTRRFVLLWIAASVPLPWIGDLLLEPVLRWVYCRDLGYWPPLLPIYAATATATAVLQSRVLARHRRPIRGWIWAGLAGSVAATVVFLSLGSHWKDFQESFGKVKLPAWWFWSFSGILTLSCSFCIAVAEACALWGRRWKSATPWWVTGRVGVAVGLLLAMVAFGLFPLGHAGLPYDTFPAQFLGAGARHVGSAAATAWLLDRLAFRELLPRA